MKFFTITSLGLCFVSEVPRDNEAWSPSCCPPSLRLALKNPRYHPTSGMSPRHLRAGDQAAAAPTTGRQSQGHLTELPIQVRGRPHTEDVIPFGTSICCGCGCSHGKGRLTSLSPGRIGFFHFEDSIALLEAVIRKLEFLCTSPR